MLKIIKKIYNKFENKNLLIDFCFGTLLLLNWNKIDSNVSTIIATFDGNMIKVIDINSPIKCEQSAYLMVHCNEYGIYVLELSVVLAALLYYKHKKMAFICLISIPVICSYAINMLI